MKKTYIILVCLSLWLTGCTSGYRVYVNGYSEQDAPIRRNASIYVSADDPNSQNPIFDKQIKTKIEALLKNYDYVPASDIEQSQYRIAFQVGMNSHQVSGYEPQHSTYFGLHSGYWSGYHFGHTMYFPYSDTYYDRWLAMKVYTRDSDTGTNDEKVVWVGEAAISTSGDDIRRVIDYLLVGCFKYFGIDTSRQRELVIAEDNPEILQIESLK